VSDASNAAATLRAEARAALSELGEGDAWSQDLWYASPVARSIASVRALTTRESAQSSDLTMLQGNAAGALQLALAEYAAAASGGKAAWDVGVRVIAAHAAAGSFAQACDQLIAMVREQRTSRLENAWKVAVELARLRGRRNAHAPHRHRRTRPRK
jgi:hypothetical protein